MYHLLKTLVRSFRGLAAIMLLASLACGTAAAPPLSETPAAPPRAALKVVTTTTVLADLARNVGGGLAMVASLVPPGADVHSFQTTPSHSIIIGEARLIVTNGQGLDDFLTPVLSSAQQPGAVQVIAAQGLYPAETEGLELVEDGHGDESGREPAHGHDSRDPHFWLDPTQTIHYVERIRDGMIQADPANARVYHTNAEEYIRELNQLDQEIFRTLDPVPPERRHLVTFHDAYGYFGRRYNWQVSAFVTSDAGEVTPAAVVEVMGRIRNEGIPSVFAEPQFNADVLREAAADTGVKVGTIRSLPDDAFPTYVEMMRSNARSLAENLR